MNFLQFKCNYKVTLKLAFVGLASLLFLSPLARAKEQVRGETTSTNNFSNYPVQLTQQQVCPSAKLLPKRSFDTPKYYVYICRGDNENSLGYYVRVTKNGGNKFTIPVSRKNGETYLAIKGEVTYVVTPYELLVSKQGRVVTRERVNSAIAANGKPLARGCPDGNTTFVEAETQSFIVFICGENIPNSYVAVARNGNDKITLPLQSDNAHGEIQDSQYIAVKGDIRYLLTCKVLRVSRDGKTVVKEKILRWN